MGGWENCSLPQKGGGRAVSPGKGSEAWSQSGKRPGGGYATTDMQACQHAAHLTYRKHNPPTFDVESELAPGSTCVRIDSRKNPSQARDSESMRVGGALPHYTRAPRARARARANAEPVFWLAVRWRARSRSAREPSAGGSATRWPPPTWPTRDVGAGLGRWHSLATAQAASPPPGLSLSKGRGGESSGLRL